MNTVIKSSDTKASQSFFQEKPLFLLGHSTVEYALPLAIIGLVVFLGVGAMTPIFSGFVGKSLGQRSNQASLPNNRTIEVRKWGANPLGQPAVFTLSDGTQIQLSQFPNNLQQSVESVGVNGTTDLLANSLKELAQKLLESGKIDASQAQDLITLANRGHILGKLQGQVEEAVEKAIASKGSFKDQLIEYKDLKLPPGSFASLLGVTANDPQYEISGVGAHLRELTPEDRQFNTQFYNSTYNLNEGSNFVGEDRYAFFQQLQKTAQSGALNDENVKNLVKSLSANIDYLTQVTGTATDLFQTRMTIVDGINYKDPSEFKTFVSQTTAGTQVNAANICIIGNGKDVNQTCHN
jgi:polyhydroxyalkanoate synthesis regulator phasin